MIAAAVIPGAISLSSCSHLPPKSKSDWVKPVILPPGRATLATKPAATGSGTCANTIGTVRLACCTGPVFESPVVTTTSGASATSSAAYLRLSLAIPRAQALIDSQGVYPEIRDCSGNRWLPQTTCASYARKFRRSSAAVATRREDHRPPRSGRVVRHRRWDREQVDLGFHHRD